MCESSMKNKTTYNTIEHAAAADIDSNTKLKWSDDLTKHLLKALSNFKTAMEFQNKDFNTNKPPLHTKNEEGNGTIAKYESKLTYVICTYA